VLAAINLLGIEVKVNGGCGTEVNLSNKTCFHIFSLFRVTLYYKQLSCQSSEDIVVCVCNKVAQFVLVVVLGIDHNGKAVLVKLASVAAVIVIVGDFD
jgi:hypothetical protein